MVSNSSERIDEVFHALSSGTRRQMLRRLTQGDCTVGELARPFAMSKAAVSKHLAVLARADLVQRRASGRQTICHLNYEALEEATRVLDYYRGFWNDQIDSLERFLVEDTKEQP
jgi:DNA-binding transcriptional ArsR family regulator